MAAVPVLVVGAAAGAVAVHRFVSRMLWRSEDGDGETTTPPTAEKEKQTKQSPAAGKKKTTSQEADAALPDRGSPTKAQTFVAELIVDEEFVKARVIVDMDGITVADATGSCHFFPLASIESWGALPDGFFFDFWPDDSDPYNSDEADDASTLRLAMRTPNGKAIALACKQAAHAVVREMARNDAAEAASARSAMAPTTPRTAATAAPMHAAAAHEPGDDADSFCSAASNDEPSSGSAMVEDESAAAIIALAESKRAELAAGHAFDVTTEGMTDLSTMRRPPMLGSPQSTNESILLESAPTAAAAASPPTVSC